MTCGLSRGPGLAGTVAKGLGRAAAIAATLALGACAQMGELGFGDKPEPEVAAADKGRPQTELEKATEYWAKQVVKSPRDGKTVMNYAKNLKALGRKEEALRALQAAYIYNGDNREYLSEYGRLALELGQVATAAPLLERADDPAKPDWRIISARGTVLAKQGNYKEAIGYFERAREIAPAQASVLNNLAMAYAMDGQAEKAETMLREAAQKGNADPKVKQNLALVLRLQGKPAEDDSAPADGAAPAATAAAQPAPASTPAATPAVATAGAAKGQRASASPGTAPLAPVEATPLDPEAIIKAANEAEAAKTRKATTPVATGSTKGGRPAAGSTDGADTPALKPSRR